MPNLEGLGLQNFRTFNKRENFEFAPITIITGTNNAGKSSVFKAIQFLVHNFKDGINSETLDFKSMRHELGNLERIFNRTAMDVFKNSKDSDIKQMYFRINDFLEKNKDNPQAVPIFNDDSDLVFAFPISVGGGREISASLEIRYELTRVARNIDGVNEATVSHGLKNIAVLIDGEHLHWTNIIGHFDNYDDSPHWEMKTSIDLKKIIHLIQQTPPKKIKNYEPNKATEDYITIDLYKRIEQYEKVFLEFPFFKYQKDGYESFTEKFIEWESLFSDYSALTDEKRLQLEEIEQQIINDLFKGKNNDQLNVLECFKHSFSNILTGMERDIVNSETKPEKSEKKQKSDEVKDLIASFATQVFQTSNSKLFSSLLEAIEKDFLDAVHKKIDSFKKVYFLPTSRGRNREWFIDEQNSEDIHIVRDFSAIYLESHPQIRNFVNFWIGKGEIHEQDQNGNHKQKGFKIGKELSVYRDESIGLTKVFLVNFDGTKTPLVDLGYGVSQLLPIIMKIATIAKEQERVNTQYDSHEGHYEKQAVYFRPSTLLIEEPEANLHPSLQSKVAELLIDAASRFNIQFLIETHSEYLIYKFQEYIGRKILNEKDIKMYYFNHPNDVRDGLKADYISQIRIENDGSIDYEKYFGEGFFEEQSNLKLSLLNIRRDRFVEEYDKIKNDLKESAEALKDYNARIEALESVASETTSDKTELEKQLEEIKRDKNEKEVDFQKLIEIQEAAIDAFTAKNDFSNYVSEIEAIIDKTKIDPTKTLPYLATGRYLLKILDDSADFAPVIIQYGRAVEFQLIKWMNDFKNLIHPADKASWSSDSNYKNSLDAVCNG